MLTTKQMHDYNPYVSLLQCHVWLCDHYDLHSGQKDIEDTLSISVFVTFAVYLFIIYPHCTQFIQYMNNHMWQQLKVTRFPNFHIMKQFALFLSQNMKRNVLFCTILHWFNSSPLNRKENHNSKCHFLLYLICLIYSCALWTLTSGKKTYVSFTSPYSDKQWAAIYLKLWQIKVYMDGFSCLMD